jgi:TRAP-type mannitol/chloroaromatic compound transport system permease large subunit
MSLLLGTLSCEHQQYSFKDKLFALWGVLHIVLIVGVLGAIYAGIATPTAATSVGSLGSITSAAIYRRVILGNIGCWPEG